MGSKDSRVFLASPAVVAASAIAGRLAHPESIVKEAPACLATA
jgi:homoaconitase/3-isopropylmalate dehydratase large subunit